MSKSNLQETGYLKLVFQNVNLANIGDAVGLQGSSVAGSLYIALYKTDPTDADTGTEADYTGYARVAAVRSAAGWTIASDVISNAAIVLFGNNVGANNTVTHFGVHTASSGGDLVGSGALTASATITNGDTPKFDIGALTVTET